MAYGNYANFDYDRFFIEAMRQLEEQNKREEAEIARLKAQSAASQPKTTTHKTTTPKTTTSTTSEPKTATLPSLDFGNMLRAGLITALRFTGSRLPEHSTAGQLLEALSGAFAEKWGMRPLSEAINVIEEVRTGGKAYEDLGFQESFSRSLGYGVGQALEDVGSALQWKGKQDLGEMIEAAGRAVSAGKRVEGYTPEQEQKMGIKVWLKPKYWATTQAASLPIQAPLMAAAIAPTVVGGALGGPLGTAVGATAGAAISRPAESYLEAGQAYTEAKRLGYDEEIARKVADTVFKENLKIGVADIPELAALFAPIPSPLAKGAATPCFNSS